MAVAEVVEVLHTQIIFQSHQGLHILLMWALAVPQVVVAMVRL
jgi:hypothetical protein